MKTFDWIVFAVCTIWLLANLMVLWRACAGPLGNLVTVKGSFFFPLLGYLFLAYRLWG